MNTDAINALFRAQKSHFQTGATLSYDSRLKKLKTLKRYLDQNQQELNDALASDLGKSEFESYTTEVGIVLADLSLTLKKLKKWMKPKRVGTPLVVQPATSHIRYHPLGVNLIISPFNYPMNLTLSPLIAAIAAGNTAIVKTSELTPACSNAIQKLVENCFSAEDVAFVPGELEQTQALLDLPFDHIFFTGSSRVGAIVMEKAAEHLSRVTLELGGKSPCIVHKDAKLDVTVNRIAFGKFINAGQTCVAPDYVLVHRDMKASLVDKLSKRISVIFGDKPQQSPDYGRIVNQGHMQRLIGLMPKEGIIVGGDFDLEDKYIAPTLIEVEDLNSSAMQQEIFGPILPIITYDTIEDVQQIIQKMPQHPLACYLFSESEKFQQQILDNIQFGGAAINHCLQHLANHNLPFGGVGQSGQGSYHGLQGFEQFSHKKSVYKAASWIDLPLIYPPYKGKLKWIKTLLK